MFVVRMFAIMIGIVVMIHSGVMATDPHGQHAAEYDPDHTPVLALVCDESAGLSAAPRAPIDPAFSPAIAMPANAWLAEDGEPDERRWDPPLLTGATLRAFLQVFLN